MPSKNVLPEALKAALHRNPHTSPSSSLFAGMVNVCMEKIFIHYDKDLVISSWGASRDVSPGCYEKLVDLLAKEDIKPVYVSNSDANEDLDCLDSGATTVYASLDRHIVIALRWSPLADYKDEQDPKKFGGRCEFQIVEPFGGNKNLIASRAQKIFDSHKAQEKSYIYTIITCGNGFALETLGIGGIPLIKENYSTEVQESYQQMVDDLKSKTPLGRLSIINGTPGTGKTYLVRGLVDEIPECKFIIVPPHLVSHLSNPEFLAFFISDRASNTEEENSRPLVLILEDADTCLTNRGADNMSSISAILNLTDGIIGSLLNFRIIATTNAKKVQLDPALKRAGRLSVAMTIDELDKEQIIDIYMRLTKSDNYEVAEEATSNCSTLADVYATAKGAKKTEKKTKKVNVVGFNR